MKKLSKKSMKSIGVFAMCMMLLCAMNLNTFAYQADFVKKENHFGDANVFHGRLYVMHVGAMGIEAEGSAETTISKSSEKLTEILVQYWFEGYSCDFSNTAKQVIAEPDKLSTQSYSNTTHAINADRFRGYHKVKYEGYPENRQWSAYTIEEGVFY